MSILDNGIRLKSNGVVGTSSVIYALYNQVSTMEEVI